MARYDDATQTFVDAVSEKDRKKEMLARQGAKFVKGLATGGVKQLPRNIAKRAIGIASVLSSDSGIEKNAMPTILGLIGALNEKYEMDWHDWAPETLERTLFLDFNDAPDDEMKNRLHAIQLVCKTNYPFEEWHIFEKTGHAINGNMVNFGILQPLELDEVALTVKIMQTLRPKAEFEDEILGYIASCAKEAGVVYLPEDIFPLGCNEIIDHLGNHKELRTSVRDLWLSNNKKFDENTEIGVQLARLREIEDYVQRT